MGWIEQTNNKKWRAGYRDPSGKVRHKTFSRRADAKRFLAETSIETGSGSWIDPRAGKTELAEWVEFWWETMVNLRPSTRARYRYVLDNNLLPHLGKMALNEISPPQIRHWVANLSAELAPATVRKAYVVLTSVLKVAVENGLIAQSPCRGISLPKIEHSEMRFLTPREIHKLADAIDPRYRALVLIGAYGGLRWGEMAGLRRDRFDAQAAELKVAEILVEVDGRTLSMGPPKTRAGRRTVPIPTEVASELLNHIDRFCAPDSDLIFASPEGGFMRRGLFRQRVWLPAVKAAEVDPLRVHDLRHTAIALWIATGAHVQAIKTWAGHSSASVVLDRYGHLFPSANDDLRSGLGDFYRKNVRSE